jgi:predicted nucleotidyltransferase
MLAMDEQKLAEQRQRYRRALAEALDAIPKALAQKPEVRQAILFGSYAAGRRDLFTDLDLLIVMDSSQDFVSRTAEMYCYLGGGVDLDLLVYTPEELERNRHRAFIRQALEGGIVIYEKQRT